MKNILSRIKSLFVDEYPIDFDNDNYNYIRISYVPHYENGYKREIGVLKSNGWEQVSFKQNWFTDTVILRKEKREN